MENKRGGKIMEMRERYEGRKETQQGKVESVVAQLPEP
jgi:hypothetical protein